MMLRPAKTFLVTVLRRTAILAASAVFILALARLLAVPVHAGPADDIKSHAREAGHDVASGAREAAHEIAAGSREAGHAISASAHRVKASVKREAHSAASAVKRELGSSP